MPKEKPILFKTDMVKAADEGRKTHTRRIIKPQPRHEGLSKSTKDGKYYDTDGKIYKPKYQPGDHLWIKQNFQITDYNPRTKLVGGKREDGSEFWNIKLTEKELSKFLKWKWPYAKKSKLFMFKSLAYKWLEVISVRAECLQDITEEDILKEGVIKNIREYNENYKNGRYKKFGLTTLQVKWIVLWNSINAKREFSWDSNPYIWDYEFKRIKK